MPQGKPPLAASEIALIRRWIEEGAKDDTPPDTTPPIDAEHPPIYSGPPVITSLDWSPNGELLAVAGFHEVLLHKADGSGLVARLVGMAERIESVRFSPDGTKLAVTGGRPARTGEVQIWDVAEQKLLLSVPVTNDDVFGASWSPDGKRVAFGCTDKSVRAIDAETGEQVLFQQVARRLGARHRVLGRRQPPGFGRPRHVGQADRSRHAAIRRQHHVDHARRAQRAAFKACRRIRSATKSCSAAPTACRASTACSASTARQIGDDANLLWELPPLPGRVFSVDITQRRQHHRRRQQPRRSRPRARLSHGADPEDSGRTFKRFSTSRCRTARAEETAQLHKHFEQGVKTLGQARSGRRWRVRRCAEPERRPRGRRRRRRHGAAVSTRKKARSLRRSCRSKSRRRAAHVPRRRTEQTPAQTDIADADQRTAAAGRRRDRETGGRAGGHSTGWPGPLRASRRDGRVGIRREGRCHAAERSSRFPNPSPRRIRVGFVTPVQMATPRSPIALGDKTANVDVASRRPRQAPRARFRSRHRPDHRPRRLQRRHLPRRQAGKNGFKLSLRGYDPVFDVRALTDDLASRRVNVASPAQSLMLLKPTAAVPHAGGQAIKPGSAYYESLRQWIAAGAQLDLTSPRVTGIEVTPQNPVVETIGARQQVRVVATYADGTERDVTREAFVESGNTDVVKTVPDAAGPAGIAAPRRGGRARALRRQVRGHDAHRDGRPHRLRVEGPAGQQPHRRAGRRQAQADEDAALRRLRRRRIRPPRVSRPDRPAADAGAGSGVRRRQARHESQARRARRQARRQRRLRRVLDQQVGRPA